MLASAPNEGSEAGIGSDIKDEDASSSTMRRRGFFRRNSGRSGGRRSSFSTVAKGGGSEDEVDVGLIGSGKVEGESGWGVGDEVKMVLG
jgi:hypothetical protein